MLKIDLHLHSTFSDGTLSPEDLVRALKAEKVSVAALTDHDTADGTGDFLERCRRASIRGVAGVELSAAYERTLHILGYRFDIGNEALQSALAKNRKARGERNVLICEKLRGLGFDISLEELRAGAGGVIGRPHMARAMRDKGYVPDVRTAFEKYLKRGAAAYVPRVLLSAGESIQRIREAGGLPVLAHPLQTTPDLDDLPAVLRPLKDAGLWGLECWFAGCGVRDVYRCLSIAGEFGLHPTAGSDFHSGFHFGLHGGAKVGVAVNDGLLPWARLCGGL
ncbi:MAG: PHP domain-containing protein [Synergistaceae bacterium]|nr:PHP domain-containing protein [Synergistaceae bacterium]